MMPTSCCIAWVSTDQCATLPAIEHTARAHTPCATQTTALSWFRLQGGLVVHGMTWGQLPRQPTLAALLVCVKVADTRCTGRIVTSLLTLLSTCLLAPSAFCWALGEVGDDVADGQHDLAHTTSLLLITFLITAWVGTLQHDVRVCAAFGGLEPHKPVVAVASRVPAVSIDQ